MPRRYARNGAFKCTECRSKGVTIGAIVGGFLATLLLAAALSALAFSISNYGILAQRRLDPPAKPTQPYDDPSTLKRKDSRSQEAKTPPASMEYVDILLEHIQLTAIVLALPLDYPAFLEGLLHFCGSITGGLGQVYQTSCLLDPDESSFNAAAADLLTQMTVSLTVVALLPIGVWAW